LYFTACLWPDFGSADLDAAVQDFCTRHRRFGRIPATV
jgi:undecaprenyl diphosphate synthase